MDGATSKKISLLYYCCTAPCMQPLRKLKAAGLGGGWGECMDRKKRQTSNSAELGNGRNTVSRALLRKRELTEFCGKLGEFCEKLGAFAFIQKS